MDEYESPESTCPSSIPAAPGFLRRCGLKVGHSGGHEDRSELATTAAIWCWDDSGRDVTVGAVFQAGAGMAGSRAAIRRRLHRVAVAPLLDQPIGELSEGQIEAAYAAAREAAHEAAYPMSDDSAEVLPPAWMEADPETGEVPSGPAGPLGGVAGRLADACVGRLEAERAASPVRVGADRLVQAGGATPPETAPAAEAEQVRSHLRLGELNVAERCRLDPDGLFGEGSQVDYVIGYYAGRSDSARRIGDDWRRFVGHFEVDG